MPLRRHQVPAAVALLSAKKTTGIEGRALLPATVLIQGGLVPLGQPGLELLLFLGGRCLELLVAADLLRPACAVGLAIGIHQFSVGSLQYRLAVLHAEALQQDTLSGIGLEHRQGHRDDLAAVDFPGAGSQQYPLAIHSHRHRRAGLHALAQR